jgi:hypothetical protein
MKDLEYRFLKQIKQSIKLLWDINNNVKCTEVSIAVPNFNKDLHENKPLNLVYTIDLEDGKSVHHSLVTESFGNFVNYLSKMTIECLTKKQIS